MNFDDPVPMAVPRTYHSIRLAQLERANASLLESKRSDNATIARQREENKRLRKLLDEARLVEEIHLIREYLMSISNPADLVVEDIHNLLRYVNTIATRYEFNPRRKLVADVIRSGRHVRLVKG